MSQSPHPHISAILNILSEQEKRYRSMQEHIRRAHPDYYIPKLPATEESFQLMITTPPSQKPPAAPPGMVNRRCMYVRPDVKDAILKPRQRMPANTTYMVWISVAQKPRHTLKVNLLRLRMLLLRLPNYTQTTLPWAGKRTLCVSPSVRF